MPEKRLDANAEPGAVKTLRDLVENLERIEDDFRKDSERQKRFRQWVIGIGAVVILGVIGILYTAIGTNQLASYVADCQNPQGECARKSNERVSRAVERINQNVFLSSIYFGECARSLPDIQGEEYKVKLRACVEAKRKAEAPR